MNEQTLAQLLEETRTGNKLLKKQLLFTRIAALAVAVLAAVMALFAGSAMREVQEVTAIVKQLDLEKVVDTISGFDVDALNNTILELQKQVETLDINEMNQALEALESAAGSIDAIAERFNKLTGFFR